jgi:hypothetical protein
MNGNVGGARLSERGRAVASVVLAAVGGVLILVGAVLLYARAEIIDESAFADRASQTLSDDEVRHLVSEEIVVQLIESGSPDLLAARPVLEPVVDAILDLAPFQRVFRAAARQGNRLLFVRERRNVAFDVSDALQLVKFGLRSVSPELAAELPKELDLALVKLERRDFARRSLAIADDVRVLGIVVPLLALAALAGAVAVAPDRRVGVLRAAVAVAAAGAVLAIALLILRERTLAGVVGDEETTDAEVRGAVAGILDAYFGSLLGWALLLAFGGLVMAGAAAVLDPERTEDPAARLRRRLLERPRSNAGRALRGAGAIALGFFVALEPSLALQLVALLGGAYLVFFGTGELLMLLQPRDVGVAEGARTRRRALATAGLAGLAIVAATGVAIVVLTEDGADRQAVAAASPEGGCNGSPALCRLRLNEAVFAGTHNSFSAADSPGWLIANQRHDIGRQLSDGIRLFLIDPHWGVPAASGRVRTDFEAEGRDRNRVAKALPPETLKAAGRLAGRIGLGDEEGEREVFLCHTACELGATRMVDALEVVRDFLSGNPGEVVIFFVEPYVAPAEIAETFEQAGLDRYVATLDRGAPLPTLGELVESGERLVVLTEKDADGSVPWYMDGFSFVQDTPLGAKTPDELRCARNRGTASSPLLMLNHWADVFPPRRGANPPFQTENLLTGRAHECAHRRGLPVNLIAVDHYDLGDLVPAVAELNRERVRAAARRRAALHPAGGAG